MRCIGGPLDGESVDVATTQFCVDEDGELMPHGRQRSKAQEEGRAYGFYKVYRLEESGEQRAKWAGWTWTP